MSVDEARRRLREAAGGVRAELGEQLSRRPCATLAALAAAGVVLGALGSSGRVRGAAAVLRAAVELLREDAGG